MCTEVFQCQQGRRDGANCYSDIIKPGSHSSPLSKSLKILLINGFRLVGLKELIKFFQDFLFR